MALLIASSDCFIWLRRLLRAPDGFWSQAAFEEGDEDAAAAAGGGGAAKRTRLEQIVSWMNGGGADAKPAGEAAKAGGGDKAKAAGGGKAKVKGEGAAAGAGGAKGCVLFDECHKAKNLVMQGSKQGTLTGKAVLELQELLPHGRVVYCSATGASSVKNMAYMVRALPQPPTASHSLHGPSTAFHSLPQPSKASHRLKGARRAEQVRLGLWGPQTAFERFGDFATAIEKSGVGAMELVALDMKQRGM